MGVGTGGMEPVNVAMVGEWWQKEDRGFAVGTHHTGFPIGQFLGPLLIGVVLSVATWRAVFLFIPLLAIPIVVVQIVLARRENLNNLDKLPPFCLFLALPLKIRGGSGSPVRAVALVPR